MPQLPADRVRDLCLALPDANEKEAWGEPTYRIRDKIFAMVRTGEDRPSIWCKAPPGSQAVLVGSDPGRFFAPPYVGPKGWIGVWLDQEPDWDEVDAIIRRSYCLVAPKKLSALLNGAQPAG